MARWPSLPGEKGTARWGLGSRVLICKLFLFIWVCSIFYYYYYYFLFTSDKIFFGVSNDFADRHATEPNINLVNKESLDNIFRAGVFVHEDGQLRVAHLILGYKPISPSFQTSKCMIRARDPRLHRISVASPGFLLPEGVPVPEGTLLTHPILKDDLVSQSILEGILKVVFPSLRTTGASASSQPTHKEEGEGDEEREKEIVDVLESDSKDLYEIFNQSHSPATSTGVLSQSSSPQPSRFEGAALLLDEMGIQRKPKSSLLDLIESQPGRDAPGKATQTKPPTPPLTLPLQPGPADHKRKREPKGKEVVETRKTHPS